MPTNKIPRCRHCGGNVLPVSNWAGDPEHLRCIQCGRPAHPIKASPTKKPVPAPAPILLQDFL